MSKWIKHEKGQPCPVVDKHWIKAVRDADGWVWRSDGINTDRKGIDSISLSEFSNYTRDAKWTGDMVESRDAIAAFKIKKKYKKCYLQSIEQIKQQKEEEGEYKAPPQPGEVWVFEEHVYLFIKEGKFVFLTDHKTGIPPLLCQDFYYKNMEKVADTIDKYYEERYQGS